MEVFTKDAINTPDFFDMKNYRHKILFQYYQDIFNSISQLLVSNILPLKDIKRIKIRIDIFFDQIVANGDPLDNINNEICFDIIMKLEKYLEIAIEEERFEVCHNLKKYDEINQ